MGTPTAILACHRYYSNAHPAEAEGEELVAAHASFAYGICGGFGDGAYRIKESSSSSSGLLRDRMSDPPEFLTVWSSRQRNDAHRSFGRGPETCHFEAELSSTRCSRQKRSTNLTRFQVVIGYSIGRFEPGLALCVQDEPGSLYSISDAVV